MTRQAPGLDDTPIFCNLARLFLGKQDGNSPNMTRISKLLLGAALLGLSACGGDGDDAAAENVGAAYENKADEMDAMAENASGAASDSLEDQADQLRDLGEAKEEAIDEADVNAATSNVEAAEEAVVNGM